MPPRLRIAALKYWESDMDFSQQVAIITGGASGMGAATVREFVAVGGRAVIVDQNEVLAGQVASDTGSQLPMIGDVSNSAFCNQVVRRVVEEYGRLDILINAAGIIVRAGGVDTTDEQWQRVMNVNVNGVFFMSRAAATQMRTQGKGAIVNFGSIWGSVGAPGVAAYCTSKGAVHQLTRAMALDHALDGIRINAVCPGEVNTPMLSSARSEPVTPEMLAHLAASVPIERLADPIEIARVVLFLASDDASYMTGAMINVDAGYTAR
jgi:meso-butanediol dehydrogenase / (S,S)-butanediol dehydrogenase / diacetyl reductase